MMPTIIRTLRNTRFTARVKLTPEEYAHLEMAEGRRPVVSMPMDINLMRDAIALIAHFETPGRKEVVNLVEDEARDATEIAGW